MSPNHKLLHWQALKFLIAGGINTLLTLAIYQVLLFWMPYVAAFTIAFVVGIAFTGFVYTRFVYSVPSTPRKFAVNAIYYLLSYVVSLWLLDSLIRWLGIDERVAVILTMMCMVPVNFLSLRVLLNRW